MIVRQRTILQNEPHIQQKTSTIVDFIDDKPKLNSDRTILPQINIANKSQFTRQNSTVFATTNYTAADNNKPRQVQLSSNSTVVRKSGNYNGNSENTNGVSSKKSSVAFVDSAGKEGPRPCNEVESFPQHVKYVPIPVTEIEDCPVYSLFNSFEKGEVKKLQEKDLNLQLYYFGLRANKLKLNETGERNYGHDDEHGGYLKVTGDQVLFRYELFDTLGKGSFGQVIRAFDHQKQKFVALKIIRNKRRFHAQALIEVEILERLKESDKENDGNIIHLQDWFYFRNHLCITFELLGMNLYELIKINNYQGFSFSLIKRFAYSILQCLLLFHQQHIIHCDLKPENILLQANFKGTSAIKVIDVGSSCFVGKQVYTYIQSRFYRSPEVILGLEYSSPIDMWSLGCILAELYTGYPIFPGENEVEQLNCIMEIFGVPPSSVLKDATRKKVFFDSRNSPRCLTNSKGKKRKPNNRTLEQSLKNCTNPDFVDFVRKCLNWDANERMNPQEALEHPFLFEAREHYRRKKRKQNQSQLTSRHSSTFKPHSLPSITAHAGSSHNNMGGVGTGTINSRNNYSNNHHLSLSRHKAANNGVKPDKQSTAEISLPKL
ncbi:dual specificity tyrosine-phosphorylation-regulated kinase 4-like [Symsagittifera roscoffensis]|uniref:dual specificity tyrosine-phosphorylation-regulated kinase 4-like n=1 Tax=Symsagittifera roscoffensis TaxID=84072 RepID=UPI00307B9E35